MSPRVAALGVVMALTITAPASAASKTVLIGSAFYDPQTVTIDAGDSVTWTDGQGRHTVSADLGIFDSGPLAEGQSFAYTFTTAGTFRYRDRLNPSTPPGTVIVQAVGNAAPRAAFTASAASAPAGTAVTFDASASRDPDGRLERFQWDFDGDGAYETDTGATAQVSRAFARAGTVRVGLLVTDDKGSSTVAAPVSLTITPAGAVEDTLAPDLSYLGARPQSLRTRQSTRLTFDVSERAELTVDVERFRAGRRPVRVRRFTRSVPRGRTVVRLSGRGLGSGRYRLRVVATDAAGNRSSTVEPRLTVRR